MDGAGVTGVPVPLKAACCGLLDALSATFSVVDREPTAVGLNFTKIVQEELAASVLVQVPVPVFTKSAVFPPVIVTTIEVTDVAVVFVSVNVDGAPQKPAFILPKFSLDGVSVAVPELPVPVSVACCGLLAPLSAILSVPEREPAAPGVNVTMIVQVLDAEREPLHVPPGMEKSLPFVPTKVTTMLVTVTAVVLERVKVPHVVAIPTIEDPQL
jgi:hypothetical protein